LAQKQVNIFGKFCWCELGLAYSPFAAKGIVGAKRLAALIFAPSF
jgi:hypothetical protein